MDSMNGPYLRFDEYYNIIILGKLPLEGPSLPVVSTSLQEAQQHWARLILQEAWPQLRIEKLLMEKLRLSPSSWAVQRFVKYWLVVLLERWSKLCHFRPTVATPAAVGTIQSEQIYKIRSLEPRPSPHFVILSWLRCPFGFRAPGSSFRRGESQSFHFLAFEPAFGLRGGNSV